MTEKFISLKYYAPNSTSRSTLLYILLASRMNQQITAAELTALMNMFNNQDSSIEEIAELFSSLVGRFSQCLRATSCLTYLDIIPDFCGIAKQFENRLPLLLADASSTKKVKEALILLKELPLLANEHVFEREKAELEAELCDDSRKDWSSEDYQFYIGQIQAEIEKFDQEAPKLHETLLKNLTQVLGMMA
ncbi:MAG: hypothetical protein EBQ92_00515 [Proteobacteria bacterium]|nr:hypothetical protein [Pseudomonadota bacterium]